MELQCTTEDEQTPASPFFQRRPIACCPPQLSAQDKRCQGWQRGKGKIRAVWTVLVIISGVFFGTVGVMATNP